MQINFEILDIRAFLSVFETGSFNKAAHHLNISQPALSRRIKSLEEKIGSPLLERTTRRVTPTSVGRQMQPTLLRLIDELETSILSISETANKRAGQVTIACGPTAAFYFLPRVIRQFNQRYPQIRVRIIELMAQEGLDSVLRGEAEFGINIHGSSEPDIRYTPLATDPFVLGVRNDHPLARRRSVDWADLKDYPLIGFSRHSGNYAILDHALANRNLNLNWFYEANHLSTTMGLLEANLGVAVLPGVSIPQVRNSLIVSIPLKNPVVTRTIGIVERRFGQLSAAASLFRSMLVESQKPKSSKSRHTTQPALVSARRQRARTVSASR
jgi:DNA-binding transcriptional LysR family regulator